MNVNLLVRKIMKPLFKRFLSKSIPQAIQTFKREMSQSFEPFFSFRSLHCFNYYELKNLL